MLPVRQLRHRAAGPWTRVKAVAIAAAAGLLLTGTLPERAWAGPQVRVVVENARSRISGVRVVQEDGALSVRGRTTRNATSLVRHRIELSLTTPDGALLGVACVEPPRSRGRGRQTATFRARIRLSRPPPAGSILRIRDAAAPCPRAGR